MDLRADLRLAGIVAAALFLLTLPLSDATMLMGLTLALDIGASAVVLRWIMARRVKAPVDTVFPVGVDESLLLLRRTIPDLRMRRPGGVIQEQVRWRQAAEAHRRARESFWSQ
jgi:hypothetical protein